MCGIVGFSNFHKNVQQAKSILTNMNSTLSKRGPDEEGYFITEDILLGHKRLIVIDPIGGKQPMTIKYGENTYTLVYNGQIYNTAELKEELVQNGFEFEGHSDTEVLLKSFIHFGYSIVNKLNGIFAFAVWNEKKKELFLARDHFGVKPLYYTIQNNELIFASEIKAILEHPHVTPKLDYEGIGVLF